MNSRHLIAAAVLATTGLVTAPVALAYQDGDIVVHGGIAKTEVIDNNDSLDAAGELVASDVRGMAYGVGYLFSDRLGIELNGIQALGRANGGVGHLPANLMVNVDPMGGSVSRIQPYLGAGLDYTHVPEEELEGLNVDELYSLAGQVGLDVAVKNYLRVGTFTRHAEVSIVGTALDETNNEPMTLGGGATFRF